MSLDSVMRARQFASVSVVVAGVVVYSIPIAIGQPCCGEEPRDEKGQLVPLKDHPPLYPRDAYEEGIEGFVELRFDVMMDGTTSSIVVLNSYPVGVFEESAKAALRTARYSPCRVGQQVKGFESEKRVYEYRVSNKPEPIAG